MKPETALAKLSDATVMLAEVRDAPTAKKLMDLASAAEHFARKAKLGADAVSYAQGIKLDAERRLGQYLKESDKDLGGRPQKTSTKSVPVTKRRPVAEKCSACEDDPVIEFCPVCCRGFDKPAKLERPPTLADLGISKKLSAEAQRLAEIPDDVFARVKAGELRPTVALRDQKRATLATRLAALPAGKYRVIYADPPWKYGDERTGLEHADIGRDSAAAAQYPPMPTTEICALGVRDLAADDAVLFLWATFPLLEDALTVMRAWGFDYKTSFVWDKQRANVGNYHDARCELLLIGVRGSCPIEYDSRHKQVQSIARTTHSAKPEEFRAIIDELYPSGPRVELFRRGEAPGNWVVWGNEAVEKPSPETAGEA